MRLNFDRAPFTEPATALAWLEQRGGAVQAIKLGTARIARVLCETGIAESTNFQRAKKIIVAGTNGKGSVVRHTATLAERAGLCAATFTSPHLYHFSERIQIAGTPISDEDFMLAFYRVRKAEAASATELTYFEFITLLALTHFARHHIDLYVLEVGMGGRLDSVNVVDGDVGVIVSVDYDHQKHLGDTLTAIGREKAGIIKAGQAVILGEALPDICYDIAEQKAARTVRYAPMAELSTMTNPIQRHNATLAVLALGALGHDVGHFIAEPLTPPPARLEYWRTDDETGNAHQGILDVAHNAASARTLAAELARIKGRKIAIFAALADKDIAAMVAPLKPHIAHWYAVPLDYHRAMPEAALIARLTDLGVAASPVDIAHILAHHTVGSGDWLIVFGSFMTVAWWREHGIQGIPATPPAQ